MEIVLLLQLLTVQNLCTALFCLLVFVCISLYFRRPQNLPPGPRGWPFIGNLPLVLYSSWRKEYVHVLMKR